MSQQGGRPTGDSDDWWGQLYDDATEDTGPTRTPDSLDDRFASASGAVTGGPPGRGSPDDGPARAPGAAPGPAAAPGPRVPAPRGGPAAVPVPPPASPGRPAVPPGTPATPPADPQAAPPPSPSAPLPHVGSGPPTYDPEPTALPAADPDDLGDLVPDTVLDGARHGTCTLRATSVRGDLARHRGEPRRDALLTARFGSGDHALLLVALATGARATPRAHRAAAELCRWIGGAVGRSHARLADDIRAGRRGDLKSGLHRLTARSLGRLRAGAADQGLRPEEYAATLRCLLLPADPACRTRVFFGVGAGGLFRLRDGGWHDIEPRVTEVTGEPVVGFGSPPSATPAMPATSETPAGSPGAPRGDRLTGDPRVPAPPGPYDALPEPPREPFRFRASVARPGDVLLMCTAGLAEPLRGEPALPAQLTGRWSHPRPPGLAAFLADVQTRVKGYADDRSAAAVWEA
ncbi:protein phosphatase 2C domain-containing protein [Streptomyces glaucescens]|uniref:protein phosphatase 2C domain-containing protein n=1 Tax=Streptomyces glaucescens TaxID=1907 RepID=UPI00345013F5